VAIATTADLVSALRQSLVLEPAQLEEAALHLQARFPEPRGLARELLQRGWLTAYQVNQLLQEGGRSLLLRPYVVLERLGEGGTGQVFKARHMHMQRVVALKVIRPDLLADADVVTRFHREIQVASQVAHANVVHAYDAGNIGGAQALVLEYVEGVSLDRLVKDSGPLAPAQACDYIRQAALGLQHIHECALVHRDIKPSNLLVAQEDKATAKTRDEHKTIGRTQRLSKWGLVKILDLGLARLQRAHDNQGSTTITSTGSVMMGTPDYMAPEQALDFHTADIRADIYGLGCTFFFLLTGKPPFPGGTLAQKLMRHQQTEPPPLKQLRPGLPADLEPIVRKMLAKKPQDRYQTPGAVAEALAPNHTRRMPALSRTKLLPGSRRRWLGILIGAAALLLAAPLSWLLLRPGSRDDKVPTSAAVAQRESAGSLPPGPVPVTSPAATRSTTPSAPATAAARMVIRGRGVVRDALIDMDQPDKKFGAEPRDNRVRRAEQCTPFLVRFDLSKLVLPPQRLAKATVSFFVWDPHDKGRVKVCAFPVLTPWDEATVTWKQAAEGKPWKGGKNFTYGVDTGPAGSSHVVILPDQPGTDTVDPPLEYQLDITPLVRSWIEGGANHGLAIAPVIDRSVDDGNWSRFQMYASKHNRVQYTPTLTLNVLP
jgi:serine/threonine protein kinase